MSILTDFSSSIRKCFLTKNRCYQNNIDMKPIGIMVHSTGANNPNINRYVPIGSDYSSNHWNNSEISKCVHAFIGKLNGTVQIVQTLPWDMVGWHAGGNANNTHIGFEICEDNLLDPDYFKSVYDKAVKLCAFLCLKYKIEIENVVSHAEGHKLGIASNHADIDHWLRRYNKTMRDFRADVFEMKTEFQVPDVVPEVVPEEDNDKPDSWAIEAWNEMTDLGILDGTRPRDLVTRQELAVALSRLIKKLE